MKALQITGYGAEPALAEVAAVSPGPRQVVVDIAAASLNPLDLKIVAGYVTDFFPVTFPYSLGTDFSGRVGAVGDEVTGWQVGDAVIGRLDPVAGGACAEQAVIDADQLVPAPGSVSLEAAAGIPTSAATAWQVLTEIADVRSGQTVLVHAAAGGVGSFAVQFAKRLGAQVVATASGSGVAIARKLGADTVLDYRQVAFEEEISGVDVVVDTVGGENEARSLEVLKPGGLLVAVPMPPDEARAEAAGRRAAFVFHSSDGPRLAKVAKQIDDGVELLVDRTLPLAEGKWALAYLSQRHARGKVLLSVVQVAPGSGLSARP
ncbi:NADP-dependent oxidoreductase [Amycolatopsis jejuensis]|uniref:NADP-dependent oxidoreductase n=1 Tax=Amycolatopsis jejuensis TaxID=330084 RepID=UPI00068C315E|nr:NADP-dependent oxidoreductase [Amycolatopsis jejuensis]